MVLLLLEFIFHISRQQNAVYLYTVLVLLRIWRLLIIPAFGEILGLRMRAAVQALRCRALTTGESISAVRRVRKRSGSLQKPPKASFQGCQEFIGLINVGGAATEESTAAAAAGQTPGKTVAIAERSALSTDFPYGQSGTGRLSFRLRRLQRNAKHPAIYDSLRSVKGKAVSRLGAFSGKIVGNCSILPLRSRMATF